MSAARPTLPAALRDLRKSVVKEAAPTLARWKPDVAQESFADSASNLAHYLALRHHDLRDLQRELMRHGLSSLGRLESRVMLTLDTVESALGALLEGGKLPEDWPPTAEVFFRGEAQLRRNTLRLLGGAPESTQGRVLVTLSLEAAQDPAHVLKLAQLGADVMRINCAHDTPEDWAAMVANTRAAATATGRTIRVLMDLGGPKFRTGKVKRQPGERLRRGDRFRLVRDAAGFRPDPMIEAECLPPDVLAHLLVGTEVSFDDGNLGGVVAETAPDHVVVQVERTKLKGFKMQPERGLLFPRAELHLDPLTPRDLSDLDFVAQHADMVGFSFVRTAADIARLQDELAKRRTDWQQIGIVAKIESAPAVHNLPEIIVRAAGRQPFGVMIARGDLAVAIGFERLAEMQEEILWLCEAAHVPVIWATQVLEEMVKSGLPTRGEMTDAAMAGRAECVMLNKGPNVGEAILALRSLMQRMQEHQSKKTARLRALRSW